jgi:Sigma-70 region 2
VDEREWLAERFQAHRPHLRAVAYRMLGSLTEADDAVQEAWLRLSRADASSVENLGGWLTTIVARVCLNLLQSRRSRREEPLDALLADPIVSAQDGVDPEQQALRADAAAVRAGAPAEARGAAAVTEHTLAAGGFPRLARLARPALVNGAAGVVIAAAGRPFAVVGFTVRQGKILEIDIFADPTRLGQLDLTVLDA